MFQNSDWLPWLVYICALRPQTGSDFPDHWGKGLCGVGCAVTWLRRHMLRKVQVELLVPLAPGLLWTCSMEKEAVVERKLICCCEGVRRGHSVTCVTSRMIMNVIIIYLYISSAWILGLHKQLHLLRTQRGSKISTSHQSLITNVWSLRSICLSPALARRDGEREAACWKGRKTHARPCIHI